MAGKGHVGDEKTPPLVFRAMEEGWWQAKGMWVTRNPSARKRERRRGLVTGKGHVGDEKTPLLENASGGGGWWQEKAARVSSGGGSCGWELVVVSYHKKEKKRAYLCMPLLPPSVPPVTAANTLETSANARFEGCGGGG